MKFFHLSDLHLGKRVNEFSMLEDQRFILNEILDMIDKEQPDGIFIAGDVYDRSVPGEDAVKLLDEFLTSLSARKQQVFLISGNHDSAVKLSFASGLIDPSGIHFSPVYEGEIRSYSLRKDKESVRIYLIPFLRPATVRSIFPDETIENYTDALNVALKQTELSEESINILVAHQFVTGAMRSESEEVSVGGLDNVDASVFEPFDYVALGHIHGPQKIGRETIRYSGTPLKYSFSEMNQQKSVTVIETSQENGEKRISLRFLPLTPKHELRQIKGTYEELTEKKNYEHTPVEDYLRIVLTDEEDVPDAVNKLRIIYKNLMELKYDNKRTRENHEFTDSCDIEQKSPKELFSDFFSAQNNQPMSEIQEQFLVKMMTKIWEEE